MKTDRTKTETDKEALEVETTEKDKKALKASNTDNLRTVPGSERVVADFEKGEPVVAKEDEGSATRRRPANLMHVNLTTDEQDRS